MQSVTSSSVDMATLERLAADGIQEHGERLDGSRLVAVLSERVNLYLLPTHLWARENRRKD